MGFMGCDAAFAPCRPGQVMSGNGECRCKGNTYMNPGGQCVSYSGSDPFM